jgi:hypothetical protein
MADDQASSNEKNEGGEAPDLPYDDDDDNTTTAIAESIKTTIAGDYDDEELEDYVVNLVVNEQPEGVTLSTNIVDAAITDIQQNLIPSKTSSLIDSISDYTTSAYDELSSTTAVITGDGGKRWFGWSTQKFLLVGLIALCILAIIIALLCVILGKKFKKNKKSAPAGGSTTTTRQVVTKGISADPKYQPVPNV